MTRFVLKTTGSSEKGRALFCGRGWRKIRRPVQEKQRSRNSAGETVQAQEKEDGWEQKSCPLLRS